MLLQLSNCASLKVHKQPDRFFILLTLSVIRLSQFKHRTPQDYQIDVSMAVFQTPYIILPYLSGQFSIARRFKKVKGSWEKSQHFSKAAN